MLPAGAVVSERQLRCHRGVTVHVLLHGAMSARVLVIEDEVDLATTLEYNLRSEGLQAQLAHSGRQGLVAANADPLPDIIVLDLMLPDVAGTEICRRLREQERTREVPIIMCTAKGEEIDRVVGFEVGADDY